MTYRQDVNTDHSRSPSKVRLKETEGSKVNGCTTPDVTPSVDVTTGCSGTWRGNGVGEEFDGRNPLPSLKVRSLVQVEEILNFVGNKIKFEG